MAQIGDMFLERRLAHPFLCCESLRSYVIVDRVLWRSPANDTSLMHMDCLACRPAPRCYVPREALHATRRSVHQLRTGDNAERKRLMRNKPKVKCASGGGSDPPAARPNL